MTNYIQKINEIRTGGLLDTEPDLVAFMVRDWQLTKDSDLSDLCWSMCRDGNVHKNDAVFLLDELEKEARSR